jgi:DNA-binding transcriptional ArsR family regulator
MSARASGLEVIRLPETAATALKGTRRSLLAALAEPDSAAGLARKLGIPRQRLNYHLKALEQCGLLECVEERRKGNCTERVLRATARSFVISPDALGAFGPTPESAQDRFSASYVVAVAARTITEVSALDARARTEQRRISTLTLDSEIRFASPESRSAFAQELSDRITELVAKYHDDTSPRGRRFRLVTIGHPRPDPSPDAAAPPHAQPGVTPRDKE